MQQIQSLSITIPTGGCVNNCKYCVSKMHCDSWIKDRFKVKSENLKYVIKNADLIVIKNRVTFNLQRTDYSGYLPKEVIERDFETNRHFNEIKNELQDFYERLKFARDNGVNTVILTGVDGEILQNKPFLQLFDILNNLLPSPFSWIEAQTSGVMLDECNLQFLKNIGVKTISLSISDIFDEDNNAEITEIPKALEFNLDALCQEIKEKNFNLRLSLNVSDCYNDMRPKDFFDRAEQLKADQVTFRVLYTSPTNDSEEDKWISAHRIDKNLMADINQYILDNGNLIGVLTFGAKNYGVKGISVVIDDNCMNEYVHKSLKYIILREDLKLYSRWDTKSSLLY